MRMRTPHIVKTHGGKEDIVLLILVRDTTHVYSMCATYLEYFQFDLYRQQEHKTTTNGSDKVETNWIKADTIIGATYSSANGPS